MADTQHPAQPALLRIVKASGPPTSQIQDAAGILGIDLEGYRKIQNEGGTQNFSGSVSFSPKEEWILRWLLGKLSAGEEGCHQYRMNHDVWVLIWVLLGRVPPKTVAKLFLEHGFMESLSDTLRDMANGQNTNNKPRSIPEQGLRSDSSSTLQESPVLKPRQKGKKRKRSDEPLDGSPLSSPADQVHLLSRSFQMLPLIQRALSLATQQGNPDEISRHQMEAAIKADPETLAIIMGGAYRIINQVLDDYDNVDLVESMLRHIHAVSQLWNMRSNVEGASTNTKSNDAFSSNCLLAALELTQTLSSPSLAAMRRCQDCVRELELLIAQHAVLPARASYFTCSNASKRDVDANISYFALDVLLKELPFFERTVVKDTPTPVSKLVPRFLDIALRAVPRRSLRQQSIENPWLETLFVALSELAGFSPRFPSPKNGAQSVEPLEELLDVALLGNLPLSLNLLRDYTSKYSRILEDTGITFAKMYDSGLSPCEWSLLAKIIRLGVDIFIPNSGVKDALSILSATLKKATVLRLAPSLQADQYYASVTTNIIIPIMEGFARARDLWVFMDHWYDQLESFSVNFTEKDLRKSSKSFSIWESQYLTTAFSNLAPLSFTTDQKKHQFALVAQDLSSSENDSALFRRAMNRAVIVGSLLQSELPEDYHSSLTQTIDYLRDVTSTAVSNKSSQYALYQWRLWYLLRRIAEHSPRDSIPANPEKEESLLSLSQMVPQVIHRVLNPGGTYKWQDFSEAFEAFRYLTVSVTRAGYPHDTETMNSATEAINAILGMETYSYDTLASLEWDGGIQSVDSHLRLSLANALVTANSPQFLIYISSETRQQLFRGLCRLARDSSMPIQKEDVESEKPLFRYVWRTLATHENIMSSAPLWEDFIDVQIAEIGLYGLDHNSLEILGSVSPESISRPRRTKVLDLSLQCLLEFGDRLQGSSLANIMALMIAILDCANPSALILTDGAVLWNLIETTKLSFWDTAACTALENLAMSVLGSFTVSKPGKRSQKYCETFIKRVIILMREYKTFYNEPAMLSLCKASIPLLWSHKDALLDTSLHTELQIIRQEYVNTIISDLSRIQSDKANMCLSNVDFLVLNMMDSLSPFGDLLDQHDHLSGILDKIATNFSQRRLLSPIVNISVRARGDLINTEILANKLLFEIGTTPLSTTLENLTKILESPLLDVETRQKVLKATKEIATRLDSDDVLNFLSNISVSHASDDSPRSRLFVVGIVASSINSQVSKESSVSTTLSSIFGDLTHRTPRVSSIEDFCLTIDCLGLILRSHSRSVSQWNVDNALGMISAVTSVAGPSLVHIDSAIMVRNGGIVFGRLCDLMGSVLAAHRKKVGGRFHLVVAALQGLLRCLFIPERRKAQPSPPALPPWITVGKEVLGHYHAVQYSRLLTVICDPTVSAVKKAKASQAQHLTDETRKARGVAGQYLQYVVMEYALCQLSGRISPEVKSALMPGLYAILDAMSRDGMRAMNAAMDSSSRAVFKSLYDDYRRFGKWNQS